MVKKFAILASIAAVIVLGIEEYKEILHILHIAFKFFFGFLENIFSSGRLGVYLNELVAVLLVCITVVGIPASIYTVALKKPLPRLIEFSTIVLLLTTSAVALY